MKIARFLIIVILIFALFGSLMNNHNSVGSSITKYTNSKYFTGYTKTTVVSTDPLNIRVFDIAGSALDSDGNISSISSDIYWDMSKVGVLAPYDYADTFYPDWLENPYPIGTPIFKSTSGYSYNLVADYRHRIVYGNIEYFLVAPEYHVATLFNSYSVFYDSNANTTGGLAMPNYSDIQGLVTNVYSGSRFYLWGYWFPVSYLTAPKTVNMSEIKLAVLLSYPETGDYQFYVADQLSSSNQPSGGVPSVGDVVAANYQDYYRWYWDAVNGRVQYVVDYNNASSIMYQLDNNGRIGLELANINDNYYISLLKDLTVNYPEAPVISSFSDIIDVLIYIAESIYWALSIIGYGAVGAVDITISIFKIFGYLLGIV